MNSKQTTMKLALTSLLSVARLIGLAQPPSVQTTQQWVGMVAKYPVTLTLTTTDNLAYGTLVYTRSGIPIRVVGTLTGTSLLMHEFDAKGNVTGIYNGNCDGKGYSGTWFSPGASAKELLFAFQAAGPAAAPQAVKLPNLSGTYTYYFGPKAGFATLYVQQTETDRIVVVMEGISGEPSRSQARLGRKPLKLVGGNQAIYTSTEYGQCAIKLTFFNGGACVAYVGDAYDCGFGHNATVAGNYVRTDSRTPVFPKVE
jgi:hypothetical protein